MNTDKLAIYEQMTVMTPSDELEDAVENLLAEVKRLRAVMEYAEGHEFSDAVIKAGLEGMTLEEIREEMESDDE